MANLKANCILAAMIADGVLDYEDFLAERRRLIALRIKDWFEVLVTISKRKFGQRRRFKRFLRVKVL